MADARWLDVEDDVAEALRHFRNACALSDEGGFERPGLDGYRASMALMHALQSGHTSAEAALTRVLDILREEKPTGLDWHAKLIDRLSKSIIGDGARPALLNESLSRDLHETRRFRHRAMHSYAGFDIHRASPSIEAAARIVEGLGTAIAAFQAAVTGSTTNL